MQKIIRSVLNEKKGYLIVINQNIDSWMVSVEEVKLRLEDNNITGYKVLNEVTLIETTLIVDCIEKLNKTIHDYDCTKNINTYLELSGFEDITEEG